MEFMRQHASYGIGAYYYQQKQVRSGADHLRLEPIRFYTGMLKHARRHAPHAAGRVMLLVGLAQFVYAAGFLGEVAHARMAVRKVSPVKQS
jgi:hypothetical protein